jgi:hypothetical protein
MTLRTTPRPPVPALFIRLTTDRIPDVWRTYLPSLQTATAAA